MGDEVAAGVRIAQIAEDLRTLAQNGLHFNPDDEYDQERFRAVQARAAELLALVDTRPVAEIARVFRGDLGYRTPLVAADAAVFDEAGRILLAQRRDSGAWCMPGGAAEVGESASAAAAREAWEETGIRARPVRLLALYDNRMFSRPSASGLHLYHVVFECVPLGGGLTTSSETSDARWVNEAEALALPLFAAHAEKVPEAFRLHRDPGAPAAFH